MVKVEAVVIRERVETVIDAVEDATGHVGVTVVEAVLMASVMLAALALALWFFLLAGSPLPDQ